MTAPVPPSLICPVLIGRTPQLDALSHLDARALTSRWQTALIAAGAGIGKSRLVAEVKTHAAARGFAVLQGHCFEPDHALPDAPLRNLLYGDLTEHASDAIAPALGPMAPQLAGLLPEYHSLLADLTSLPPLDLEEDWCGCPQGPIPFVSRVSAGTARTNLRRNHESVPVVYVRSRG